MNQDAPEFLFRVLRHDGIPEPHYDLLIETSRKARVPTWRLPVWPITGATPSEYGWKHYTAGEL